MEKTHSYPQGFLHALPEIEQKLGYHFKNRMLLINALTHSSFSNEQKPRFDFEYNERLEFLGDSVLSIVTSKLLFNDNAHFPEGMLTKIRSLVVCADALYEYASEIELGKYMLFNHGLLSGGGRYGKNILADCFEAVIAAIYLDGGMEEAEKFLHKYITRKIGELTSGGTLHDEDYKSILQQKVQTSPGEKPEYITVNSTGPDHDKKFEVEVRVNSNVIGKGTGRSKREAAQAAAKKALEEWFGEK